jgi:hypothetical protein
VDHVLAPFCLFQSSFLEALFTRVYEVDVTYTGKYNAVIAVQDALERVSFKGRLQAFVHTLAASASASSQYGSTKADQQQVRLLVKSKPDQRSLARLMDIYSECESLSWAQLELHVRMSRDAAVGGGVEQCELDTDFPAAANLQCMRAISEFDERLISDTLAKAGMKARSAMSQMQPFALGTPLASIKISSVAVGNMRNEIRIRCMCNVYTGASELTRPYYFFRDNASSHEHPLLCYEGIRPGLMPIVVASQKQLEDEMKEAGMTKVELSGLTTIRMSLKAE